MPRPKSRSDSGKSDLSKAVRELREGMGFSQQAFSNALGVALNTIARYETSREPSGEALVKLARMATIDFRWDLANFFYTRYLDGVTKQFHLSKTSVPATDSEPSR